MLCIREWLDVSSILRVPSKCLSQVLSSIDANDIPTLVLLSVVAGRRESIFKEYFSIKCSFLKNTLVLSVQLKNPVCYFVDSQTKMKKLIIPMPVKSVGIREKQSSVWQIHRCNGCRERMAIAKCQVRTPTKIFAMFISNMKSMKTFSPHPPQGGAWAAIWWVHFSFRHRPEHKWLFYLLGYQEHIH